MSYLTDFLFSPARANSPLRTLSGGERNRVLLARLLALPANVLVLDEPTNDLDIETLELLEELLQAYTGTVFLVSHDRRFLDNVVTSTIAWEGEVEPGLWREYEGGYEDWKLQRGRAAALREEVERKDAAAAKGRRATTHGATIAPATVASKVAAAGKPRKLSYKEQRELAELPTRIEALGGRARRISARFLAQRRPLRRGSGARRIGADALRPDRRRAPSPRSSAGKRWARPSAPVSRRARDRLCSRVRMHLHLLPHFRDTHEPAAESPPLPPSPRWRSPRQPREPPRPIGSPCRLTSRTGSSKAATPRLRPTLARRRCACTPAARRYAASTWRPARSSTTLRSRQSPRFAGVYFRGDDANNAENFYLRVHKNAAGTRTSTCRSFRATRPGRSIPAPNTAARRLRDRWLNHVRVEVYDDSADVFVNGRRSLRIRS